MEAGRARRRGRSRAQGDRLRAQERQVASAGEAGRARAGEIPGRRGSRRSRARRRDTWQERQSQVARKLETLRGSRANWRRGEDLAHRGRYLSRTWQDT